MVSPGEWNLGILKIKSTLALPRTRIFFGIKFYPVRKPHCLPCTSCGVGIAA
jgi:hypothetical protein